MRAVIAIFLSVSAYLLQMLLAPKIQILGIMPDFIIVLLACLSVHYGIIPLTVIGAFIGVSIDLLTSGGMFLYTAIYFVVAVILGIIGLLNIKYEFLGTVIAVSAGILFKYIVLVFALYVIELAPDVSFVYLLNGLPTALYSAVFVFPLFFLLQWLMNIKWFKPKNPNLIKEGRG